MLFLIVSAHPLQPIKRPFDVDLELYLDPDIAGTVSTANQVAKTFFLPQHPVMPLQLEASAIYAFSNHISTNEFLQASTEFTFHHKFSGGMGGGYLNDLKTIYVMKGPSLSFHFSMESPPLKLLWHPW